ncbi:MAG: FKBP-type peptidyl-prolyl cis-trans isomerase [Patescibacteria group bacterium]|nr:FKBP-type peptidyl-prolyl cis-trans isomerase [Patescibacteria group bacterium]MDE2437848.1 FKBP-type peptidyl-prolyl cis-trans isomerase [Patescibacteria group bacterium]
MKNFYVIAAGLILFGILILIFAFVRPAGEPIKSSPQFTETSSSSSHISSSTSRDGLGIQDVVVGTGTEAKNGDKVVVHYRGTLENGTQFDSSYDRNQPFSFTLGAGMVIRGWDLGVLGMKVGGVRKLTIPASLGYGDAGVPGVIPPRATLLFEIKLLSVHQ